MYHEIIYIQHLQQYNLPTMRVTVTDLLLFVLLCMLAVAEAQSGRIQSCTSLDIHNRPVPGQCIVFPLCPRFLDFAKRPGKSRDDFRKLRSLTCGFNKDKPRICCPDADVYHPPAADDDDISKTPLLFPKGSDDSKEIMDVYPVPQRPSDFDEFSEVSYAKLRDDKETLIPKLEDCGEPRLDVTSTRIIGGRYAEEGEFPFMALLYRIDTETDEEEYYCSGTIINQFYILTAAHCILTNENSTYKLAYLTVGITNVAERCDKNNQSQCLSERKYEVAETIVHPKYVYTSRDRSHDIALIRTSVPIELNKNYIRPVCLPFTKYYGLSTTAADFTGSKENNSAPEVASGGVVAGWGRENNYGPQSATNLKTAILPILSKEECQRKYAGRLRTADKICAGGTGDTDVCIGDSGGPLLLPSESGKMFQAGITSFGPSLCARSGKPSVYTRVIKYIDWILDTMHL